mgnify:CR=1 FL=1
MNAAASLSMGLDDWVHDDFAVPDIRCAGCISKLENGLVNVPGIKSARVNFTEKSVRVDHAATMQLPQLVGAFLSLGFEAHPIDSSLNSDLDQSGKTLLRCLAVAGFAMMNIMLLSVSVWSGATGVTRDMFHWLSALIAMPAIAYSGRPFFTSAWKALRHGRTNMDVPITIGVLLATALSLYETATSGPHAYFDGAVMLLFFLLTGRYLDSMMRDRARHGVTALLKNMGTGAMVLDAQGKSGWVDSTDLQSGMVMLVAVGERLAADGLVMSGNSAADKSLLTGESKPEKLSPGDSVHAGTLNLDAPITVKVTAAGPDTMLADIARLMGEAAQSKSRYVRIADRAARLYAPAVHCLALLAFGGWMLAGAGVHQSLLIAVAVLIITCPCALGLAVPAAQVVTAGALMRSGILVKDGSAIERLSEIDMVFFDKTGTLTIGRPQPSNLDDIAEAEKPLLLGLAQASRHPLSKAIASNLEQQDIRPADITDIEEIPGLGVTASWHGKSLKLGKAENGAHIDGGDSLTTVFQVDGIETVLTFSDELRPDAHDALEGLHGMGLDALIISGDRAAAAAPVAKTLRLTARANMLPEDKLQLINSKQHSGKKVLMVGDGLNDGPALAAGHASMAPSSASDAGKNAADFVWMGSGLGSVVTAIKAARNTQKIVKQNFGLAIGYNIIAVPLALAGLVTPLIAAIAMSGSSLIVVANALRLRGSTK